MVSTFFKKALYQFYPSRLKFFYLCSDYSRPGGFTSGIEGPACDRAGNVYAVNFSRPGTIGCVTPQHEESLFAELPEAGVGNALRFDRTGQQMYVADYANHKILRIDKDTRRVSVVTHNPTMNQPNDLAIRRDGLLFATDPKWTNKTGQIWRISPDGATLLVESRMGTTNGIELSPDEKWLYVNESYQRRVWRYRVDPNGEISEKTKLIEFDDYELDGMRCDMNGNLYITRYGKGTIAVVSPDGRLVREILTRGKKCTNLTFGGVDGRTCFVTVADRGNIQYFRTETPGRCWALMQETNHGA